MKHFSILITFLLFLTLPFSADAQRHLLKLTDTRTGRTELVKPGATITYQLDNDSTLREGRLGQMTAFALEIDGNEISLSKVKVLGACSKGRLIAGDVAKGIGHGLTIVGQVVTWAGVEMFAISEGYMWAVGGTVTVAGGVLWGTGFVIKVMLSPIINTLRDTELSHSLKAEVVSKNKELIYPDDIYD